VNSDLYNTQAHVRTRVDRSLVWQGRVRESLGLRGYELMRIRGEKPVYPAHAAEWMQEIERFATLLSELAVLAELTPGQLAREIEATHPDHAKHSSTLKALLWQILVHDSYPVGQIAMLRRALGAWPPRGGGDSW
jgi:hypothetical protein